MLVLNGLLDDRLVVPVARATQLLMEDVVLSAQVL